MTLKHDSSQPINEAISLDDGMTHDEIKSALLDKGYTLIAAANAMKRKRLSLYLVTTRKSKSFYVANAIAVLLDKDVGDIFPESPEYAEKKGHKSDVAEQKGRAKLIEAGLLSA